MVIHKKDGSVFKLNGPNEIMFTQESWSAFKTHNLSNLSNCKMESNIPHVILGKKKIVEEIKTIEPIKEEIVEEEIIIEETPEEIVVEEVVEYKKKINEFDSFKKTIMHCALAKKVEVKDDLYGETALKVKFIDKFTFESIVMNKNDFVLIFWTKLDNLTIGSVLYPQDDSKRWWEVREIEDVPGGHKITCCITRNTPAF
jgi:hypothetical protein